MAIWLITSTSLSLILMYHVHVQQGGSTSIQISRHGVLHSPQWASKQVQNWCTIYWKNGISQPCLVLCLVSLQSPSAFAYQPVYFVFQSMRTRRLNVKPHYGRCFQRLKNYVLEAMLPCQCQRLSALNQ